MKRHQIKFIFRNDAASYRLRNSEMRRVFLDLAPIMLEKVSLIAVLCCGIAFQLILTYLKH